MKGNKAWGIKEVQLDQRGALGQGLQCGAAGPLRGTTSVKRQCEAAGPVRRH